MATKVNLKDIGWMYHSPAKKEDKPEIRVPPTSQIPLLGNMPDEMLPPEKESMQGCIKDTDSPYIILAKTGGRKDLLRFKENKPNQSEGQGYPRCDWFYLEDNQLDDNEAEDSKDPWVFKLPDYMVHQPWNPTGKRHQVMPKYGQGERGKPPFATEQDIPNHMLRFDKRNRLPEMRKQGFGVRAKKMEDKNSAAAGVKQTEIAVRAKPHSETELKKKARRGFQNPSDCPSHDKPSMDKLLSMGYAKDWSESHDAYEKEKSEAARAQAEKLRNLQARIHARETQQQRQAFMISEKPQHGGVSTQPWKPTTKAADLL